MRGCKERERLVRVPVKRSEKSSRSIALNPGGDKRQRCSTVIGKRRICAGECGRLLPNPGGTTDLVFALSLSARGVFLSVANRAVLMQEMLNKNLRHKQNRRIDP